MHVLDIIVVSDLFFGGTLEKGIFLFEQSYYHLYCFDMILSHLFGVKFLYFQKFNKM